MTQTAPIATVSVPLSRLRPAPWNPRLIKDKRFQQLCQSLQADPAFLWERPVLATLDGTIYGGNMRYRAAEHLHWEAVPARLADLTEAQAKARALRDNNSYGEWQEQELAEMLVELQMADVALDTLGFPDDELARLLDSVGALGDTPTPEAQLDRAAELQAQWSTVDGQAWLLGAHRLVIGDCTDPSVVATALQGAHPILLATDPPYGVELDQGWRDRIGLNGLGRSQDDALAGDDRADWAEAYRLGGADVAVVWHAGIYAGIVATSLEAAGYEVLQQIVWVKNMAPLSRSYYHWRHEPAWFARRKGSTVPWHVGRDQTTVWEAASPKHIMSGSDEVKQDHPTQKPIALWLTPIQNHTARGEIVYEPFAGSGTAILACEQLGRECRAIEVSPKYAAVILQRWVDATGQAPVCESGR